MTDETDRVEEEADEGRGTIGSRLRALRRAAGLSQTALAGDRFSKEYVSQIERGKTRPSAATLAWLAVRLGTDLEFLEHGFRPGEVERAEELLTAADGLSESHLYTAALEAYRSAGPAVDTIRSPALTVRLLNGEAWALLRSGNIDAALTSLERAQELLTRPECTPLDRAEVLFRVGVCRYSQSEIPAAIELFTEALGLAGRSASDTLRADILGWRSRCYRRERDWVAAWDDIERALELADVTGNRRQVAETCFQASLVTQRQGRWLLARRYAERAKSAFEELGDRATAARVLNNIAGLDHLLGNPAGAVDRLQEAFSIFVEAGLPVEAGYTLSSQADIQVGLGDFARAEEQARKALELLDNRVDHLQEIGTTQLALGRALTGQGKIAEGEAVIAAAELVFEQAQSLSHRADAWIARGDLETRRGDDRAAADHFRQAAEALRATGADPDWDLFPLPTD